MRLYSAIMICASMLSLFLPETRAENSNAPFPRCWHFIQSLWGEHYAALPREAYLQIEKHPLRKLSLRLQERGIPIEFTFEGHIRDGGMNKNVLGETLQSKQLERILREIFPTASFRSGDPKGKESFLMMVADSAEAGLSLNEIPTRIEMAVLKAGNPYRPQISRASTRQKWGIEPDRKVASVYMSDESGRWTSGSQNPSFSKIVEATPLSERADIYFVSLSPFKDIRSVRLSPLESKGYQVTTLSSVLSNPNLLSQTKTKWVVLNDLRGRMGEIYASSDYAIVKGPNNIFEPLQQGVPLIFYENNKVMSTYLPDVFAKMSLQAQATGGAFAVRNAEEFSRVFQRLPKANQIKHPAFVIDPRTGKTPFEVLLDRIQNSIQLQLKNKRIQARHGDFESYE